MPRQSYIVRILAVLAIFLQVTLPVAQAQAAANGTPLASLICNPSGQPLNSQAKAAMADLLDTLGGSDTPEAMPDCERCVVPAAAIIAAPARHNQTFRFSRASHQHPLSTHIILPPVRGPPCGTRAPPPFV